MSDNTPGWQSDPTGRHEHRYWDGSQWTDNVADAGVSGTDAYTAPTEATPVVDEPTAPSPVDPTVAELPPPPDDPTAAWAAAPAPPPAYSPEGPVESGDGSKKGLLIGGGIVAAIVIAAIAFFALSGDDDDVAESTTTESSDDGTTTESDSGSGGDLRDQCADGDFDACDDLYLESDLGSDDEEFGSTCGGIAEPQSGSCALTNGGEDELDLGEDFSDTGEPIDPGEDLEGFIADMYVTQLGLNQEQADCLAGKILENSNGGTDFDEEAAAAEVFDYLSDCDISMEDINAG